MTHCHVAPRSAGGAARRPGRARARARVAPVDEAAMQAKLRELRSVMAKERTARTEMHSAMEANGGRIWSSSKPTTLRSRDGGLKLRELTAEELERIQRAKDRAAASDRAAAIAAVTAGRARSRSGRRVLDPLDASVFSAPAASARFAARVRVVVRPAERVHRGARSSARDERGVRPPARERAPGARGRIGGARAGRPDPPRPRRASGAETPGGAARLAARLRAARAERARERPLDERASGRVAPRRERHDRAHGRRHDRARGRRGGRRAARGVLFIQTPATPRR